MNSFKLYLITLTVFLITIAFIFFSGAISDTDKVLSLSLISLILIGMITGLLLDENTLSSLNRSANSQTKLAITIALGLIAFILISAIWRNFAGPDHYLPGNEATDVTTNKLKNNLKIDY